MCNPVEKSGQIHADGELLSESTQITSPIVAALNKAGYFAMRLNSGRVRVRGGFMTLCPVGTADILLCLPDRLPIWVETKAVKKDYHKEQQEAQGAFRARVEALGHTFVVARSLDDVLEVLR